MWNCFAIYSIIGYGYPFINEILCRIQFDLYVMPDARYSLFSCSYWLPCEYPLWPAFSPASSLRSIILIFQQLLNPNPIIKGQIQDRKWSRVAQIQLHSQLIVFFYMIHLLRRVVPRSIINFWAMKPVAFRDEMEIPSGTLYGFSKAKDTTPVTKTMQRPAQGQGKQENKKKQKQPKGEKGQNAGKKEEHQKGLGFEIKTPKGTRDYLPDQMAIRRKVIDMIVEVFKKHGGVEIDTPVFELKEVLTGKYGQDSKLIYDLEDQGGQRCSLRYDLTVPFARFMANNTNFQKIKRFHIGKVYRRDQPTVNKGRFRQFYQCDFDIAGKYDPMIPDAEVLAIMQEILETVGVDQFLVKVNHRKILEMMIKEANCEQDKFKTICSSIDKLDKQPWAEIRKELVETKGITEEQADVLGKLTEYKGSPKELLQKIIDEKIFAKTGEAIKPYLEQMSKLFEYLEAMDRIAKVSFDLSLARGLDYYTGLIYEIVLTDKTTELGSISGGGRYDDLIGMFSQHEIPSVGGSIGIERLFTILEKQYENKVKKNPCEVLVATIKNIPVKEKMGILSKLWKCNIKAETLYVEKAKPQKQIEHAFDNGIPFILWIGEDELKSGQLNLKILYQKEEVKVPLETIGQSVLPYIEQFRKDYELGKVELKDPNKKQ